MKNIAIIGSSGSIGRAFTSVLSDLYPNASIYAFSRGTNTLTAPNIIGHLIDYTDETTFKEAAMWASTHDLLDMVIVATGVLHNTDLKPEKSLRDISTDNFLAIFQANTILPALVAKYFLPKLHKNQRSIFVALSARVGSISDNRLGGWYAYRASKAALNMIIKNASIEIGRQNKNAIIVGLHPGTVDSNLSKPFQTLVPNGKLFTPEFSVSKMLSVINGLQTEHTGKCFGWDGSEITP